MAEPYLSQITMIAFNFVPRGYAYCDGEILPINQNQELFSLLGTTYGGDGRTSFGLPELRGRVPIHFGTGSGLPTYSLGQRSGEETTTLTVAELPSHTHTVKATTEDANSVRPRNDRVLAKSVGDNLYHSASNLVGMASGSVSSTGGGQGHNNMMPFLTIGFCIAITGIFPSRN